MTILFRSVNNNRGEEHPKLVDHIILAEFDIDTGHLSVGFGLYF